MPPNRRRYLAGRAAPLGRVPAEVVHATTSPAPAYSSLEPSELGQLIADLEPISATLEAAWSR